MTEEYGSKVHERFVTPMSVAKISTTPYTAESATVDVAESKVTVPAKPPKHLTYRFKMGGSNSGANNAMSVVLMLGTTALMTIASDAAAAVDWVAEFTVIFVNSNVQKVMGSFLSDTADAGVDYAAGAVNCSADLPLFVQIISAHGSDSVVCEMVTVEKGEV